MKNILIVVDVQNDFVDGSLGTKEAQAIIPNVVKLINTAVTNQDFIFVTSDTHDNNYLQTQEGLRLPVKHCIKNTNGWRINQDVYSALEKGRMEHITFIEKPTFGSTFLAKKVKDIVNANDIKEVRICGLCTDICVISNALILKANLKDTRIVIEEKACAGVTVDKHNAALEVLRSCQCDVE